MVLLSQRDVLLCPEQLPSTPVGATAKPGRKIYKRTDCSGRVVRGAALPYLVHSTDRLLPAGAAAGLHYVADVFSGRQQLGHVHSGLRPQSVSPGLVNPRHAVHLYLQTLEKSLSSLESEQTLSHLLVYMRYLCSVRPAKRLNRDVQTFDQHPAPTLVLGGQSCVYAVQFLL